MKHIEKIQIEVNGKTYKVETRMSDEIEDVGFERSAYLKNEGMIQTFTLYDLEHERRWFKCVITVEMWEKARETALLFIKNLIASDIKRNTKVAHQ